MNKTVFVALLCSCVILSGQSWAAAKKAPAKKAAPAPAPVVQTVAAPASVAAPAAQPVKAGWFVEGGLAGGAGALELGYGRSLNDSFSLSGAVGYAIGNKYSVVVIDLARLTMVKGDWSFGAGLNYAMYSEIVNSIPGISGNISSKNLAGGEIFAGKKFGKLSARLGYSSALGLRAGIGYDL